MAANEASQPTAPIEATPKDTSMPLPDGNDAAVA